MRVFVATEQHFIEYNDAIYTTTVGSYSFWRRYLDVFERAARIRVCNNENNLGIGVTPFTKQT